MIIRIEECEFADISNEVIIELNSVELTLKEVAPNEIRVTSKYGKTFVGKQDIGHSFSLWTIRDSR